ncbi:MAG: hypothetical protein JNN07_03015 [Verrucomicrobiales bacterium]|nr:hypothetical protein [Verrucomicrobiales bacterium]
MEHRHLNTHAWSAAAIDSALERGGLNDWQELFAAVKRDPNLASLVLQVASQRNLDGASILAQALVKRMQPELDTLSFPRRRDYKNLL